MVGTLVIKSSLDQDVADDVHQWDLLLLNKPGSPRR